MVIIKIRNGSPPLFLSRLANAVWIIGMRLRVYQNNLHTASLLKKQNTSPWDDKTGSKGECKSQEYTKERGMDGPESHEEVDVEGVSADCKEAKGEVDDARFDEYWKWGFEGVEET
jgi:hypothetical protein